MCAVKQPRNCGASAPDGGRAVLWADLEGSPHEAIDNGARAIGTGRVRRKSGCAETCKALTESVGPVHAIIHDNFFRERVKLWF